MPSADFAAAQQRVAARQQAREESAKARSTRHQARDNTSTLPNHLPTPLSITFDRVLQQWDLVKGREGTNPAFRVGQVDAELLDGELLGLLKGQVGEALKYFDPHLRDDWNAEILLALRSVLFKLTLWDHDASYGASLQSLRYADARKDILAYAAPTRWQKAFYGLFSVGGRYAWTKWEDYLLDAEGGYDEPSSRIRLLSRLSSMFASVHSAAAFASFLVFLYNGKYRTLLDRILRLRLTPTTSQVSREVSFEYLNRQLVWHAFTEFLLFLLPLVGISRWRRWISRAWRKVWSTVRGIRDDDEDDVKVGEYSFLPERTCAICYQDQNPKSSGDNDTAVLGGATSGIIGSAQTDVTNPYQTIPCGCIYCYVCLAKRLEGEEGEGWTCIRCGAIVRECRPWHGDVVEDTRRLSSGKSSGKSVTFADLDDVDQGGFRTLDPIPVDEDENNEQASLVDAAEADEHDDQHHPGVHSIDELGEWDNHDQDDNQENPEQDQDASAAAALLGNDSDAEEVEYDDTGDDDQETEEEQEASSSMAE